MKKIVFIALSALMMSCNGIIGDGFEITGEVKGIAEGTKVFLEKQDKELGLITLDTVQVTKGKFTFEGKAKTPEMHTIRINNLSGSFAVVLERGDIKTIVNKDTIYKTQISGTYNNDELNSFNSEAFKMQKRMSDYEQKNIKQLQESQTKNDTVTVNRLRKGFVKIQKEFELQNEKYISNHPKAFISVLLIEMMIKDMEPKFDKIRKLYDGLDADVKETKPGIAIKTKLDGLNAIEVGKKAPEFSGPNPEGKIISLKESLGKVTIVDFWASWCAPCRQESPNFVALYNEFHSKGLNFIGVALEKKGERVQWKEAIAADKLNWIHVSNLEYWSDPIAKKYSVEGIPATFILDKNGIIVAKNLRGAELKAKVAELLAK